MNIFTSPIVRWLCFLAMVGAAVIAVFEHSAIAKAGMEHQVLLKESDETQRLTRENRDLEPLRAANDEVKKLRQNERELLRLRNQAGQLRAEAAEAAKLRADNRRLASLENGGAAHDGSDVMPRDFISRAAMADVGLGSPEAAVQTYFYALSRGDVRRLFQCEAIQFDLTPEQERSWGGEDQNLVATFPGFRIAEENNISADEVEIGVQASVGGTIFSLHVRRNGNEWNVKQ